MYEKASGELAVLWDEARFFRPRFCLASCAFCNFGLCGFSCCVCPDWEYLIPYHGNSGVQGTDETELV